MALLRPRNRLIYFRVSEDEYRQYNHMCESTGSRSISELARSAMRSMAQSSTNNGDLVTEKLMNLETMVCDLNRKLHEISVYLSKPASQSAETAQSVISR